MTPVLREAGGRAGDYLSKQMVKEKEIDVSDIMNPLGAR